MAKSKNDNLHKAKDNKQDEFYTRLEDIENELRHYKQHFTDKTVICNCTFFVYIVKNSDLIF